MMKLTMMLSVALLTMMLSVALLTGLTACTTTTNTTQGMAVMERTVEATDDNFFSGECRTWFTDGYQMTTGSPCEWVEGNVVPFIN